MKIKAIVLVAAAVLAMGTAALAKDKGTLSKFPNWGVITVPDDIYMQSGRQPMLTAADEGNDVIALFERIFPIQPETYQVVKKDDADFQYAYLLHYTATIWDVKAAVYGENRENSYLRDIGSRPDMRILMNRLNQNMPGRLPEGFHVVSPVTAKKTNGHLLDHRQIPGHQRQSLHGNHPLPGLAARRYDGSRRHPGQHRQRRR